MSNGPDIHWVGQSGQRYGYYIYPIESSFKKEPGNYIFAHESQPNTWRPDYIGETGNLDERLENHNEEACARRHGATHIHAHVSSSNTEVRRAEEQDLVLRFAPPCNG